MKQLKQEFIAYLSSLGIYDEFVRELENETEEGSYNSLDELVGDRVSRPYSLIAGAFYWSNSNGGHDFWSEISDLWKREVTASNR